MASLPGNPLPGAPSAAPAAAGVGGAGARVNVGSITMNAFLRAGAVQGYFPANAAQRLEGGGRYRGLFIQKPTPHDL